MMRQPGAMARALLAAMLMFSLLTAVGCGRERKKFVGSWRLEIPPMRGVMAGSASLTMTFRDDGTGTMGAAQSLVPALPASQSQAFEWRISGDKLVISYPDAGVTQEVQYQYEFKQSDELILRVPGRGPEQRYRRVK